MSRFTATQDIYLDAHGRPCSVEDDHVLFLVAAGNSIPLQLAQSLGLLDEPKVEPVKVAENKAVEMGKPISRRKR